MDGSLSIYSPDRLQEVYHSPRQTALREQWAANESAGWAYPRRLQIPRDLIVALNHAQTLLKDRHYQYLNKDLPGDILPLWKQAFQSGNLLQAKALDRNIQKLTYGGVQSPGLIAPFHLQRSDDVMAHPILKAIDGLLAFGLPSVESLGPFGKFEAALEAECLYYREEQKAQLLGRQDQLLAATTALARPAIEHPSGQVPEQLEFRVSFRGYFLSEDHYRLQHLRLQEAFRRHGVPLYQSHWDSEIDNSWRSFGYPWSSNTHPLMYSSTPEHTAIVAEGVRADYGGPCPHSEIKIYSPSLTGPKGVEQLAHVMEALRESGWNMIPGSKMDITYFPWKFHSPEITSEMRATIRNTPSELQGMLADAIFERSPYLIKQMGGEEQALTRMLGYNDLTDRQRDSYYGVDQRYINMRQHEGVSTYHTASIIYDNIPRLNRHLASDSSPTNDYAFVNMGKGTVNVLGYPELEMAHLFVGGVVSYNGYPASTSPNTVNFVSMLGQFVAEASAGKRPMLPLPKNYDGAIAQPINMGQAALNRFEIAPAIAEPSLRLQLPEATQVEPAKELVVVPMPLSRPSLAREVKAASPQTPVEEKPLKMAPVLPDAQVETAAPVPETAMAEARPSLAKDPATFAPAATAAKHKKGPARKRDRGATLLPWTRHF